MKPALAVLVPVCLLQVYWTRLDFVLLLDNVLNDDTFLYLQIVRNIADHGRASFDGVGITTGFQPLWALLLVPLAIVVEDRIEFVRCVLLLSVLLNLAAGLLLVRIAATLGDRSAGVVTAWLWAGYMLAGRPAMVGMESPLLALAFSGFLLGVLRGRAIGPVVSAVFLSRTDALLFAPLAGAFQRAPVLLRSAMLSLLLVAPYLAFNLAVSGRLLPISGAVKLWWARHDANTVHDLASRALRVAEHIDFQVLPLQGLGPWAALFAVAVAVEARHLDRTARRFFLGLFAPSVLHVLVLLVLLGRFGAVRWYYVPEYVSGCLFLGVVLGRVKPRLLAPVVAVLMLVQMAQAHRRTTVPHPGLYRARYELALDIGRTLPTDAVIGSWNAGQLGYFTPQRVVNLDGLVNDASYLDFLRAGGDVREYLKEEGIEYVADYNYRDSSIPLDYEWDRSESFRGLWRLAELDVVLRRGELLVFRVEGGT